MTTIRTSPCHHQMDGQVERLNQTLKKIFKKVAAGGRKQWDVMLPYIVWILRGASGNHWVQLIRVTTGTRSQRTVRRTQGELDWSRGHRGGRHLLRDPSSEKIVEAREIVEENSSAIQARHKEYYDRSLIWMLGIELLCLPIKYAWYLSTSAFFLAQRIDRSKCK